MAREPADHLTAPNGAAGDLAARVGERIRRRRGALGRTLADVAEEAHVSVSYLSAVENGGNVPSLPVLLRIVHALRLTLHELLREEEHRHVRVGVLDTAAAQPARLHHPALDLRVASLVAEPGEAGNAPVPLRGAALFVFVQSGALSVDIDGASYALGQGDALDAVDVRHVEWHSLGEIHSVSLWGAGLRHPADAWSRETDAASAAAGLVATKPARRRGRGTR